MRRLFVPGYYSGFSNQKMSLDIAVVLAHLTGRVLVPYRFRVPRQSPVDDPSGRVHEPLLLPHLFDIPVAWSDEYLMKTWVSVPGALEFAWAPVFESVLAFPTAPSGDDAAFQHFRNGRRHVCALDERHQEAPDLHVNTLTLGHYSHYFYLDEERRREVIDLMRCLRPRAPYLQAAERIAASLGSFNAVHIRRGDFLANELTKHRISRTTSVSGGEIVANLATRMERDVPLVVCTDGSPREEVFSPIRQHFRETIFLHRYLRESAGATIEHLPHSGESVEALLTQLVAARAQVFAGTMFSTFTALIHRMRGLAGGDSGFLYSHNDFRSPLVHYERCEFRPVGDGPYSWNRIRYPLSPDAYSWIREWPEAFGGDVGPAEAALPAGTIDLGPRAAVLHGSTIRRMEDGAGRLVIGDWTEGSAFVTWDLALERGGTYSVSIRYACPEESAGSSYSVGLAGGDELRGQVWSTGSWESLSPWLPIGRLRIPDGPSTLTVRAIEQASDTVMNLSGVRLIPV